MRLEFQLEFEMVTVVLLFLFFVVCVKINRYLTDVVMPLPHDD